MDMAHSMSSPYALLRRLTALIPRRASRVCFVCLSSSLQGPARGCDSLLASAELSVAAPQKFCTMACRPPLVDRFFAFLIHGSR